MEKPLSSPQRIRFIDPDWLSYFATIITVGVACFYYYSRENPSFLLWAIVLIILRMLLNKFDGDIAFERNSVSVRSKIINALPDRYSDIIIIIGIGISSLCHPIFSLLGLAIMLLISYTGLLGKALGVGWQNQGPLGKVERLILIILFTLAQYFVLINGNGSTAFPVLGLGFTPLEWCMIVFIILGQITVFNRLCGIGRENAKLEWLKDEKYKEINQKILIAYDSQTENTERLAEEISNCLKVGIRRIDDISKVESYDLVIFGSRDAGRRPSPKMIEFITQHQNIKNYAVFITYKNQFLGPIFSRMCLGYFKKILNKNPLAVFFCKAALEKDQLYLEHPTDLNLLNAFLFGIKVVQKLAKK